MDAALDSNATISKRYDWGIKNPPLLYGAFGIRVKAQEKILVFGEAQFSHILFQTKSGTLTDFDVNGKELINTLPLSERKVVFEKSLSSDNMNTNAASLSKAIVQKFPVTYVGFEVGIAYIFNRAYV